MREADIVTLEKEDAAIKFNFRPDPHVLKAACVDEHVVTIRHAKLSHACAWKTQSPHAASKVC